MLKLALSIMLLITSVLLIAIALTQEMKQPSIMSEKEKRDSYWEKNKKRSLEGKKIFLTRFLVLLFLLEAIALNRI